MFLSYYTKYPFYTAEQTMYREFSRYVFPKLLKGSEIYPNRTYVTTYDKL